MILKRLPIFSQFILGFSLAVLPLGCSSPPMPAPTAAPILDHTMTFAPASQQAILSKVWTKRMKGLITDVDVSRNGKSILVAASPDHDTDGGSRIYTITELDQTGKVAWELEPPAPLKSLAASEDGSIAFLALHNDTVWAVNSRGETLWTVENSCRPIPFFGSKKLICYHDDDATPSSAFDAYDFKGNKLTTFPIHADVLALKFSPTRKYFAVALTHGQVILLDQNFKVLWQKKVPGEVVDFAITEDKAPSLAVLTTQDADQITSEQKVTVLDSAGKVVSSLKPNFHLEQLETVGQGSKWVGYGNSDKGQHLEYLELSHGKLRETWERGDARPADYSSSVLPTPNLILFGFEDSFMNSRHSHLLGFDLAGGLKLNLPLVTDEGAYLFAQAFAPEASLVVVGTDDGFLSAYHLK